MRYNITRKINLGRFGFNFESVDLGVVDCESKEQAETEVKEWAREYIKSLLDQEQKLTKKQFQQREELKGGVSYAGFEEQSITT